MLAKITGCTAIGVEGLLIDVEVDVARGLPTYSTVGLPDSAVRENKDRVKAAISNCGYEFPNKKITVNLAPADVRKEGAGFDLPTAIGILAATEIIPQHSLEKVCMVGELSLDGKVRRCRGILPMVVAARDAGYKKFILPRENSREAAIAADAIQVIPVSDLPMVVEYLLALIQIEPASHANLETVRQNRDHLVDFSEVKGQNHVKRGLEIAAAGGHNLLMSGPPGAGKTMLARRLATILPQMMNEEVIETTKIYSVSDMHATNDIITERPFRAPHHTVSDAGLIGGGTTPKPGEVSLAHNGVLFLDELPEFKKHVLEVLRQPLEDGHVTIARASMTLSFPSRFILVAAMNPCPCGFLGDPLNSCTCTSVQVEKYRSKVSGPLLDRIDLYIPVPAISYKVLTKSGGNEENSASIRNRVNNVRSIQQKRFSRQNGVFCNSQMGSREIDLYCTLDSVSSSLLEKGMEKLGLSARGYHRVLRLSRTIADLDGSPDIGPGHIAEALQYRRSSHYAS
ncbi:YifB family Mg chelatase-like AAA ATPase [Desulfopila sp. IMCC35008]|uniref:YifB family Mg chelatase-like AAA ATPase n=1 Tax=Desulfopila sp. IMCC35008 TaxID=2653858 RepID=UPI0013D36592|nr:YifB family Mg chelatase-like AAA ATPase [Desulfopila sp. IMCC35008]